MSIEPFTFAPTATQAQRNAITPALEEASELIGDRLKAITLVPKKADQMPDWDQSTPGIQPAWGVWKGFSRKNNRRELWYWEEVFRSKDCVPLIQHEILHAYDTLYMTGEMRADQMELMHPKPEFWTQGKVWSKFPFECGAVYGSAALFGIVKPVYANLLDRKVYKTDFAELKSILLAPAV